MDKLNQLLVSSASEFAAAFDAVDADSAEPSRATPTFWLEGGITRAGAGFVWGNGAINYQGGNHAFRVSGLSVADVDATSICANGSITHLRRLSDFNGSYSAMTVRPEEADDDSVTYLKNERGVVMKLTATDAAWRINLLINGLRVRLKRQK